MALGQADTRQIKNAMQRGELVRLADVQRRYGALLARQPETIRSFMKDLRTQLNHSPVPSAAEWDGKIDKDLDDLFRALPAKILASLEADRLPEAA